MTLVATVLLAALSLAGFQNPPDSAKPIVRWFWMGGNISERGITRDLEAIRDLGCRGANIMFQDWYGTKPGPVKIFSEEWWKLLMHAGREADRLGLELSFHNCPGWSSSGGPSVKPENAQKILRYTETRVKGGSPVEVKLPAVPAPFGWQREIAVLAVPFREGEDGIEIAADPKEPGVFRFPMRVQISYAGIKVSNANSGELALDQDRLRYTIFTSDDGVNFKEYETLPEVAMESEHGLSFHPVICKAVKLVAEGGKPDFKSVRFSFIPRIPHYSRKSLTTYCRRSNVRPRVPSDTFECPVSKLIALKRVVDISPYLDKDGVLRWRNAPYGEWRVFRFMAVVQKDAVNHIAPPGGSGLELDKLSPRTPELAMSLIADPLLKRARREGIKAFKTIFLDSFEVQVQNWTDGFLDEFRRRRGYDLKSFLPTFAGVFIESTTASEMALADFRKTWAELFAENYGDRLAAAVRKRGLSFMRQSYYGPFDELRAGRDADIPAVEFWYRTPEPRIDMSRLAFSLAAPYGHRIVAAEAFTDGVASAKNLDNEDVVRFRLLGDRALANGVNLFEFHGYEHQPGDDPAKRSRWPFGCRFDRLHPKFKTFKSYVEYLTRAQYLMQMGDGVADVLYVADGPSPVQAAWEPELPFGWKGDCIDSETYQQNIARFRNRIVVRSEVSPARLRRMLENSGLKPDFVAYEDGRAVTSNEIVWCHRALDDGRDLYFVANVAGRPLKLSVDFRASGHRQILNAEDGSVANMTGDILELPSDSSRFVLIGKALPTTAAPIGVDGSIRGKLPLPFAKTTLEPSVALPGWRFISATSGCAAEADGSRSFGIDPIWDQRVKFFGRLQLKNETPRSVRVTYEIAAEKELKLEVMQIGGSFPVADYAGGSFEVDGVRHTLASEYAGRKVIAGGAFTNLVFRDARAAVRLAIASERPLAVLLQDAREWKQACYSLRLAFPKREVYRAGETNSLSFVISSAAPLKATLALPLTLKPSRDWVELANASPWIESGSALDFSNLIKRRPVGELGRVRAVGEHFECERQPGVPQRFYGVNVCADMLGITDAQIDRFLDNLVRTGYNSLRVHHYGDWLTSGSHETDGCTFHEPRARRLDRLVSECGKRGIYITTDLYVSRHVPYKAMDIDRAGEASMGDFKHLVFVHEGAYRNFEKFTSNLLCRVNTYTGRRYADDPTIAFVSILNESSLVSGGTGVLKKWPCWQQAWNSWTKSKSEIPSSIEGAPTPEKQSFALFLAHAEERFYRRATAFLRGTLGCKALFTNMNGVVYPIVYQRVRAELHDYVDEHYYIDHAQFLGKRWWGPPYTFPNVNPVLGADAGVPASAVRRIFGKPFTVSEYCYCGPGRYRIAGGALTGALAALQDWSAVWHFAWTHGPEGIIAPEKSKSVGMFDVSGDPVSQLAERTVAALFLRGDLQALKSASGVRLERNDLSVTNGPYGLWSTSQTAGFLGAGWRTRIGMFLGKAQKGVTDIGTYPKVLKTSPDEVGPKSSATSEVSVDSKNGTFLVNTPRTCVVFGEGGTYSAGALKAEFSGEPACISAIAIDSEPIASSRRILVTHLTDVQNTGVTFADDKRNVLLKSGTLPHLVRRSPAKIELKLAAGNWKVYALSTTGARLVMTPAVYRNGVLSFVATALAYEIQRANGT